MDRTNTKAKKDTHESRWAVGFLENVEVLLLFVCMCAEWIERKRKGYRGRENCASTKPSTTVKISRGGERRVYSGISGIRAAN